MNGTYRVFVLAAVMIAAVAGCQKAQKGDASKSAGKYESKKRSAEGGAQAGKGGASKSTKSAAKTDDAAPAGTKSGLYLTQADDGRHLNVRDGDIIVVKLKANRASGFGWVMADGTGDVLVRAGNPVYAPNAAKKGKAGSGGTETWRFRAVHPGEQTMRLEYRRPWERDIPERTMRFTVTVK